MKDFLFHKGLRVACMLMACVICFSCGGEDDSVLPPTPTNPTHTTDPTESVNPSEPTDEPTNPTDPVEPADPVDPIGPVEKKHRTVILYMAGDNSLSHFLQNDNHTGDIDELLKGASSLDATSLNTNNVLVFIDNAEADFLPTIWRLSLQDGQPVLQVVKQFETDVVSTDPSVIQEVVDFAKENYPAESYGFVYWSHGDGWLPDKISKLRTNSPLRFIGVDQQNGTIKSENAVRTNVADLAKVLGSLGQKFEFVLFDACYMLSMEVAYELRNCTDYLIASPTETPASGAPYDTVLSAMLKDSGVAQDIGKLFYDYYADRYDGSNNNIPSGDNWHGGVAIGVINCTKLDALASATSKGLQGVSSVENESLRQDIFNYDRRAYVGLHYFFDMVDLMQALMPSDAFNAWLKAYQDALSYWYSTPKFYASASRWFSLEGTHGLTHYIPMKNDCSASSDIAYRSTSWYKDAELSQLGW